MITSLLALGAGPNTFTAMLQPTDGKAVMTG
jgi:hypothetical protein